VSEFSEITFENELGTGCFGTVYLAKCRGKHVAVKKLHSQEMDELSLAEFKREVGFLTHLRHPNIVLFMGACIEKII